MEDVLFGEEHFNEMVKIPSPENISELLNELDRLRKHSEHTTSLLNESEAANGRLIEQSRCLKEEIRRLERNEERKSHLENTEYLKNVIVKVAFQIFSCLTFSFSVPDPGKSSCREVPADPHSEHDAPSQRRRDADSAEGCAIRCFWSWTEPGLLGKLLQVGRNVLISFSVKKNLLFR